MSFLDKLKSTKFIGLVSLIALSTWGWLTGHATGTEIFYFWGSIFSAYIVGDVSQTVGVAKYTPPPAPPTP